MYSSVSFFHQRKQVRKETQASCPKVTLTVAETGALHVCGSIWCVLFPVRA